MDEQIKSEFEKSGFSLAQGEEVLQKCLTYCINFKLSSTDLVSHWEVYYLNRHLNGLMIENADMDGFLSHLQNEQKESIIKEEAHLHIYSSNDVDVLLNGEYDNNIQEDFFGTPTSHSERPYSNSYSSPASNLGPVERPSSRKTSGILNNPITPFGQRSNKFVSLFTINNDDVDNGPQDMELENSKDDVLRRVRPSVRCSFLCSEPEPGCRFMYDRTEDKFISLENRIQKYTSALVECGLYGEPTVATMASEKRIFAVGMVCCDGEGHLNEKSILLQGSVKHSGGERVRLDVQRLSQLALFPGQVIGVEGKNPSGHCLVATRVVDSFQLAPDPVLPLSKKQALNQGNQQSSPSSTLRVLSMIIASGPFTTTDNLLFEPLTELLAYARRKAPQLIVLMGPFVDSEHPEIKKGTVDQTFDDIFNEEILRRLLDYIEYMGPAARIVLLPSIRDANHDFVFPQPAFNVHPPEDINQQITFLANPTIFSANEVMLGCTTTDILKHLSSEEISRLPANASGDRMSRLATHVLNQRSFYPLYPPASVVPLDLSVAPKALEIPSVPDILLLVSDLTPFVKVLSVGEENQVEEALSCMCVNPGRLAKGIEGGTFVEMNYNGDPGKTNVSIIRI